MAYLFRLCSRHSASMLLVLVFLTTVLCSCGAAVEADITLYTEENWKMEGRITIPAEAMALVTGGVAGAEANLDKTVADAKAAGANAKWRREKSDQAGGLVYVLETEGKGFGPPLAKDFQIEKVDYNGREALKFTVPSGSSYAYSGFSQNLITVHGGQILESNGTYTSTATVAWTNPSWDAYAILTPKSRFLRYEGWIYALGVLATIGVLAGIYLVLHHRRIAAHADTTTAPVTNRYCPTCGAPILAAGRFCMQCGQPIPQR